MIIKEWKKCSYRDVRSQPEPAFRLATAGDEGHGCPFTNVRSQPEPAFRLSTAGDEQEMWVHSLQDFGPMNKLTLKMTNKG